MNNIDAPTCIDPPWKCNRCGALLGYAMTIADETHLRIKVKDQIINVVEPKYIDVNCRKCSWKNVLSRIDPNAAATESG